MSSIELANVSKAFTDLPVIKSIDLVVHEGEFVVLLGSSGSGKSTLLRLIAGLEHVDQGRVLIDGADVTHISPADRGLAMVFQSYALYPHMTVAANIGFPLMMAGVARAEIQRRVADMAELLGLSDLLARKPAALSGGQRQRVGIGRALARNPRACLFDEPLSNLDAAMRASMRIEIRRLQTALGSTAVYVTHDQVEAMTMADRIVLLHEGVVVQSGPPRALYERPVNQFVATFLGSPKMNLIRGAVAADHGAASIGVRPEHLRIVEGKGWPGTVISVEDLGHEILVHVELRQGGTVCVRLLDGIAPAAGNAVNLASNAGQVHRFDQQGQSLCTS
ncbi:ABC transporter ATP-binding protein [Sphingomonas bacterium]|uniref:ABC transporter ATP-binding protein n=1 Tax=Sphingomonas bacterium TaxID=1895847 RepID=UPI0015774D54|nr:ABC transporter ATP-binding protein [Sphingomonas bacterium]